MITTSRIAQRLTSHSSIRFPPLVDKMVSKAEAQKAMEDAKRASDAFFRRNDAETKKLLGQFSSI